MNRSHAGHSMCGNPGANSTVSDATSLWTVRLTELYLVSNAFGKVLFLISVAAPGSLKRVIEQLT